MRHDLLFSCGNSLGYFVVKKHIKQFIFRVALLFSFIPIVRCIVKTKGTHTPVRFRHWLLQKMDRRQRAIYWPIHRSSVVSYPKKTLAGIETAPGFMPGCYIQGQGGIEIGDFTQISANVGLISQNHSIYDAREHIDTHFPSISIGRYCWLGMNVVILPEVKLGDFTIVGAGSVVTKSFEEGHCVIAGSPARVIKRLDKAQCVEYGREDAYHGFVPAENFSAFRKRHLEI